MRSASAGGGRGGAPVWTEAELSVLRQCVRENGLDNWGLGCWKEVASAVGGGKTAEQCFNRWHDEYLRRVALEQQQCGPAHGWSTPGGGSYPRCVVADTGVIQRGHHRASGGGAASSDSGSGGSSSSSSANQHVAMSLQQQQQQQQQRAQAGGQGYPVYWRSSYNGPPPAIQSNASGWHGRIGAKWRGTVAGPESGGGHDALRNLALLATIAVKSEEDSDGVKREKDGTFGGV